MASISMRAPKLTCVAVVAALCLIGWVAVASSAQDSPPKPAASTLADIPAPAPSAILDVPHFGPVRTTAPDPVSAIDHGPATETDDPEKAAMVFVEQNEKMAESQLQNLRAEQAKLRARLLKVEAGIKRWDTLLGALKQSQGTVAVVSSSNPAGWKQTAPVDRDRARSISSRSIPIGSRLSRRSRRRSNPSGTDGAPSPPAWSSGGLNGGQ